MKGLTKKIISAFRAARAQAERDPVKITCAAPVGVMGWTVRVVKIYHRPPKRFAWTWSFYALNMLGQKFGGWDRQDIAVRELGKLMKEELKSEKEDWYPSTR